VKRARPIRAEVLTPKGGSCTRRTQPAPWGRGDDLLGTTSPEGLPVESVYWQRTNGVRNLPWHPARDGARPRPNVSVAPRSFRRGRVRGLRAVEGRSGRDGAGGDHRAVALSAEKRGRPTLWPAFSL